jgi:hypothetical protein
MSEIVRDVVSVPRELFKPLVPEERLVKFEAVARFEKDMGGRPELSILLEHYRAMLEAGK